MEVEKQAKNDFSISTFVDFRKTNMKITELEAFISSLEDLISIKSEPLNLSEQSKQATTNEEAAVSNLALQIKEINGLMDSLHKECNKVIAYESKMIELNEKITYLSKENVLKSSALENCKEKLLESIVNQMENQKVIEYMVEKVQDFEKSKLRISELETFILNLDGTLADIESKLKTVKKKSKAGKKLRKVREENKQLRKQIETTEQKSTLKNEITNTVLSSEENIQELNEVNGKIKMPNPVNFGEHFLPTYAQRGGMPTMVKLHESNNPWRPRYKMEAVMDEKEVFRRNVRSILNKVTPEKFGTLVIQLKNLNTDTIEKLNTISELIFEHAIENSILNFSIVYANLAKHLMVIKVPTENNKSLSFRKLLMTLCQKEFENDRSNEIKHIEEQREKTSPDKKRELEKEIHTKKMKIKHRNLGNIGFIGELFKLGTLHVLIIYDCINSFLSKGEEIAFECLCKLIKIVGKELHEPTYLLNKGSVEKMEVYFQIIQKIIEQGSTSNRIRFMLQDIIDLKRNNWIPRRNESIPKTISQIHMDAEREAREIQQTLKNIPFSGNRIPDNRHRIKFNTGNFPISEEAWTFSTKSNKGGNSAAKLKLSKPGVESTIWIGPPRAKWSRGTVVEKYQQALILSSVLLPKGLKLKGDVLTNEQMEQETKPLIDEFLHYNDFEKAVNHITRLASLSTIHVFINSAIHQVLEVSSKARHSVGLLLFFLVKQNVIGLEHYKKGIACVLKLADEFALDIPLTCDYLGEILEPVLRDDKHPLITLKDVVQPCIPSEIAGKLVSATLHFAARERGIIKVGKLWRESNLQWTDFLGPTIDVKDFILKHKLGFTISSRKSELSVPMPTEEIRKHLLSLLEKTEENEEIFDWIDSNISENSEKNFIRALVTAVLQNAIKETKTGYEVDGTKLKKKMSILTRSIYHNKNLEFEALYAVQALMYELNQPKDVLRTIFYILYNHDVITEESFKNWKRSNAVVSAFSRSVERVVTSQ